MALTFSRVGDTPYQIVGNRKETITDVTFDSSYLTGGEAWAAADLGLNYVEYGQAKIKTPGNATDTLANSEFVRTNGQGGFIKLWDAVPAQITSADDVSACVVRVTARGY